MFESVPIGLLTVTDGQYGVFEYKGIPHSSAVHSHELLKMCEEFDDFRDDDVLILSYPKTGE